MTMRTACLFCVSLAAGCNNGKSASDSATGTGSDATSERGDESTTESGGDGTTDSGDDSADLVGAWSRDEPIDLDGAPATVVWTANEDGSCRVELTQGDIVLDFPCAYSVSAEGFTLTDDECTEGAGRYTYVLSGDQLTFTLIEDRCETRADALASTWTRF